MSSSDLTQQRGCSAFVLFSLLGFCGDDMLIPIPSPLMYASAPRLFPRRRDVRLNGLIGGGGDELSRAGFVTIAACRARGREEERGEEMDKNW